MKHFTSILICVAALTITSCSEETHEETHDSPINYAHGFMAWDCPDNREFPAIDLKDWEKVPVVNGRLPTYEEAQSGKALLHIDKGLNPDLKDVQPYNMKLPQLAYFINPRTKQKEVVVVIQLVQFKDYVWAGLRYVSGGNASAMMSELEFLLDDEIKMEIEKSIKDPHNSVGQLNQPSGY